MTFLLDVNVLIALFDPVHVHHDAAHEWFDRVGKMSWATCPLTENGVLRIIGNPRYPNTPGTPATVMTLLSGLVSLPGHIFWPDDISLVNSDQIDATRLLSSSQITDTYLLALAKTHGGQLATFDRRLVTDGVQGGKDSLHLIGL
ncbi:TA system VapC family ribonuclease toxin [Phyllobacterium sp. YR531]|uniref:TA system VapC family ribonuclease toxin n=1 Tax=Phyllobacterium sp. YR531 TaxID=1144343 RepID=UPI00026FCC66|nr:TA system VapC family ribonuclease toxin [Phyllobacterium sp. YR531]EJN02417.1 putative nucleic acid-binding protein, contains PIN domain containing protein [Phyllobacterium sp. YR531]